ncbi:hypothetical protein [Prevotella sp. ne3005]|uniref:hypothetical protein n=1 Tax=Prevotella sp. ne3005 TaxID=1761887 RepID=UPI00147BA56F|nr:hypothetical protein [Prevotella sp. ne3005]
MELIDHKEPYKGYDCCSRNPIPVPNGKRLANRLRSEPHLFTDALPKSGRRRLPMPL